MPLKEIQEKTGVFQSADDALCFGLKPKDLDYLRTLNVEPVQMESSSDARNIQTKFNIIVFGSLQSIFSAFNITEKYIFHLLPKSKILIKARIETNLEDIKNITSQLSKSLKFTPETYIEEKNEVWIILSRIRQ